MVFHFLLLIRGPNPKVINSNSSCASQATPVQRMWLLSVPQKRHFAITKATKFECWNEILKTIVMMCYHMLKQSKEKTRKAVQTTQAALVCLLDKLVKQQGQQQEHDDFMDASKKNESYSGGFCQTVGGTVVPAASLLSGEGDSSLSGGSWDSDKAID
jgi:hypothetical protein